MTTYVFRCECGMQLEEDRDFGDNKVPNCPTCMHIMKQVITSNPFMLNGSGWNKSSHYAHNWKLKLPKG